MKVIVILLMIFSVLKVVGIFFVSKLLDPNVKSKSSKQHESHRGKEE